MVSFSLLMVIFVFVVDVVTEEMTLGVRVGFADDMVSLFPSIEFYVT